MENNLKLNSFKKLVTWQKGHELVLLIYKLTKKFPKQEQFVLTSQILRAAISITSNIAEGFGRISLKEKRQFYYISKGSLIELQNQMQIAYDLEYISREEFKTAENLSIEVSKLLYGLIKGLSKFKT